MKTYDHILQGEEATEENAILHAQGLDWQEIECKEENPCPDWHYDHCNTVNGIDIYYNRKANYYFFAPNDKKL